MIQRSYHFPVNLFSLFLERFYSALALALNQPNLAASEASPPAPPKFSIAEKNYMCGQTVQLCIPFSRPFYEFQPLQKQDQKFQVRETRNGPLTGFQKTTLVLFLPAAGHSVRKKCKKLPRGFPFQQFNLESSGSP